MDFCVTPNNFEVTRVIVTIGKVAVKVDMYVTVFLSLVLSLPSQDAFLVYFYGYIANKTKDESIKCTVH